LPALSRAAIFGKNALEKLELFRAQLRLVGFDVPLAFPRERGNHGIVREILFVHPSEL
jgi:hypothetical protein